MKKLPSRRPENRSDELPKGNIQEAIFPTSEGNSSGRSALAACKPSNLIRKFVQLDQDRPGRVFKVAGQDAADRRLTHIDTFRYRSLGEAGRDKELGGLLSCTNRHDREMEVVFDHSIRKRIGVNAQTYNVLRREYALTHIVRMTKDESLLRKNLDWLIKQKKTSPYELQRATGVPQPTIHRILTGESNDPRTKTLQPLAEHFGVSVEELRSYDFVTTTNDGQVTIAQTKQYKPARVTDNGDPELVQVPKVRLRVAAGISGFKTDPELFDGATMTVSRPWVERHGYDPLKLFWVRVGGRSMERTLFEDDWVLINTGQTEPKDSKIFAVNFEGEAVIKRLTRDAGQWWLTSDNQDPQYYRRQCRNSECIIVGEAVLKYSEAL